MALLPCEPARFTAFLALLVTALCTLRLARPPLLSSPRHTTRVPPSLGTTPALPPLWRRLGARSPAHIAHLSRTLPRRAVFRALADEALAPWSAPIPDASRRVPIAQALLDAMEVPNRAATARVRLPGDGRVLVRVLQHWEKTYRLPRLAFFLDLVRKVQRRFAALRTLATEFYVNVADGPRVTVDSVSQQFGALPLFAFRTASHYVDVPVPDPVEHGAKVTGEGYVLDPADRVPWERKKRRVVFRGVASCIQKQHFGNWHLSPRVRVSAISAAYPDVVDAGVTKWIKLSHNTTVEDIERSTNTSTKLPLTLLQQAHYRYILDVDGGLGSSRKRWMLKSGSVPFFQQSAVYQWYEPLLAPWVHFVPVDRWFRNLVEHVQWARQHDSRARQIAENAEAFADRFLSEEAVVEYLAVLLQKYSELQPDAVKSAAKVPHACDEEPSVAHGPMGCRRGWFRHFLRRDLPFACKHRPEVEGEFVCHRPHPVTGRKEVKQGVYAPYPEGSEAGVPRKRPGMYHDAIIE